MERIEHHDEADVIELGAASVETQGGGDVGEIFGEPALYELSDR